MSKFVLYQFLMSLVQAIITAAPDTTKNVADTAELILPDSLFPDTIIPHTFPSIFEQGSQNLDMIGQTIERQDHPVWVPLVLVGCFILLAWSRLFFPRRLRMIFSAIFAKNYANQLSREGNIFNERIGLVLFVVYLAVMGMFIYLMIPLFKISFPDIQPILLYFVAVSFFLVLWTFKIIIINLLSILFNTREHSREMVSNMFIFNLFTGIVILPLVSCMAYADLKAFFYISMIIITLTYTFRILREAVIGFGVIKFSVFHLFLYLCTLEILPLIVLAKILTQYMKL